MTEQNYAPVRDGATFTEQTGKSAPQSPFLATNRTDSASLTLYVPPTPRQELEQLVADFLSKSPASENLTVLNELLFIWQARQSRKATHTHACNVNFKTMRIGEFLVQLQEVWSKVKQSDSQSTSNPAAR